MENTIPIQCTAKRLSIVGKTVKTPSDALKDKSGLKRILLRIRMLWEKRTMKKRTKIKTNIYSKESYKYEKDKFQKEENMNNK